MTRQELHDRVTELCIAAPFLFVEAPSPFDFDTVPTTTIDGAVRVEIASQGTLGGMNFTEDRTDLVTIWLARKHNGEPQTTYDALLDSADELTSAIVHDGAETSGAYAVLDGVEVSVAHDKGQEFAVARLSLPINYEVEL